MDNNTIQELIKQYAQYIRPTLETGGGIVGGLAAAPANIVAPGVAEAGGVGLGYLGGKTLADMIEEYGGLSKPKSMTQRLTQDVPEALSVGMAAPLGGKLLSKTGEALGSLGEQGGLKFGKSPSKLVETPIGKMNPRAANESIETDLNIALDDANLTFNPHEKEVIKNFYRVHSNNFPQTLDEKVTPEVAENWEKSMRKFYEDNKYYLDSNQKIKDMFAKHVGGMLQSFKNSFSKGSKAFAGIAGLEKLFNSKPTHEDTLKQIDEVTKPAPAISAKQISSGLGDYIGLLNTNKVLSPVGREVGNVFSQFINRFGSEDKMTKEQYADMVKKWQPIAQKYAPLIQSDPMMGKIINDYFVAMKDTAENYKTESKEEPKVEAKKESSSGEHARRKGETLREWNERLLAQISGKKE